MTEGTEGGAQRALSLRPRCIGEVVPVPRRQSTNLSSGQAGFENKEIILEDNDIYLEKKSTFLNNFLIIG
jgi:hypothetical protein